MAASRQMKTETALDELSAISEAGEKPLQREELFILKEEPVYYADCCVMGVFSGRDVPPPSPASSVRLIIFHHLVHCIMNVEFMKREAMDRSGAPHGIWSHQL